MAQTPNLLHELLDDAADRTPHEPAVTAHGRSCTYRQLAVASVRAARRIQDQGVSRGDRVVVKAADGLVVTTLVYAASRLGAAFSVLHEHVRGEPLAHVLQDSEPALVVSDDADDGDTAQQHRVRYLPSARLSSDVDEPGSQSADPTRLDEDVLSVDPVCLIYTSGTTSMPKAVVSTHQQVLFASRAIQSCLGYRDDDVVYCPLPLSFDYGLYQVFLAALSGAHLWLGTHAEAGPPLLRHLRHSAATVLPGVPSVSDRLAWLLRRSTDKPERLRLLTNTGAALAEGTMAALRETLPRLRIQVMYGLTECKRTAIMPPDGDLDRPGSCGFPLPGTEVLILDDDGKRLPPGELGQFVVRGPHVMAGYWRRPELSAERFPRVEGLFPELRTGDYGWRDHDGYLYFSGRRDDIYKERGFRVSATEVESAARRVDGVNAVALIPPNETRPALLAVESDITGEEVTERMHEHIEAFKIPRRCVVLPTLPTNANGKLDRAQIVALVEDRAVPTVKEKN
ncbi:acyl-CoA synthetase (AMP-forming)/AMP-acid ligase II [Saccharopolyspora lacisalsi]|uniref:Acyl-CoA synthetase (AMP-forming)/AMP-acid ligase II n=1 Tax=Halosaccharopolyspora lacisalsi TaxID=1000566 RepID=A0A839DXM8_9PSEU|nr:class I adenylate-forming enzyme family protein [Halosaccharopolyspora lacisalsi]MBA8823981.1 acyl-CoA synthetase (AMP-forming)/AMP-acid ligase II [Halosaccharopolyspora lacisalsi]